MFSTKDAVGLYTILAQDTHKTMREGWKTMSHPMVNLDAEEQEGDEEDVEGMHAASRSRPPCPTPAPPHIPKPPRSPRFRNPLNSLR